MKEQIKNIILRLDQKTYFPSDYDGLEPYEAIMQIIIENLPEKKFCYENNKCEVYDECCCDEWNEYRKEILKMLLF